MGSTVIHDVSLVIALRNSWDDHLLSDSIFTFKIDNKIVAPINKRNGHYVFVDIEKKQFELTIESCDFFVKKIFLDISKLKDLGYIMQLPMIPKFLKSLPINCASFYGKADPQTPVYAIKNQSRAQLKVVQAKENILKVANINKLNIEGATLAIFDAETSEFEVFVAIKQSSANEYIIDRNFTKAHKKDELILKAYATETDTDGNFNIFVKEQSEASDFILSIMKQGKPIFKKIKLNGNRQLID